MRRTVTIISSIFVLWGTFIYAVDNEEIPKHYQLQGAFEGQNIENLEEAEAIFLKGPDMTPNAVQRENLPGIRFWNIDDYINASPKDRYNALLNMGAYNNRALRNNYPKTTITEGKEQHSELRTTPIESWSKEQYLDITPAEKHSAINNMQKAPFVTAGTETDIVARTKDIADYTQGELLNITPESRHEAISNSTRSFRVGRSADITIDLTVDSWASEASWNLYDSTAGAYYYTANQTFSSGGENQVVTLSLDPGAFSVDVWDSYGDGGVLGSVSDANAIVLVSWTSSAYGTFGQFGFTVPPVTLDVTIDLTVDGWASEASWNLYDYTAAAYYYSANVTFSGAYENQVVTLALEAGLYAVDVWDSYGDGGIAGTVSDADGATLVSWGSGDYGAAGSFGFGIGFYDVTASLDVDGWASEASWNLYDYTAGAYYYSSNLTFASAYENQTVLFSLLEGAYSIDVWDSYGDGGVSGTVSGADGATLVTWGSGDYSSAGSFGFDVVAPVPVTSDLFFSEYIEGSSNNKALELYNPTDDTLSLDNYLIYTNYNGNDFNNIYTFPAGATLLPGDVFVAANESAWDEILQAADATYNYSASNAYITSFNGDDVRGLAKIHSGDTTFIDVVGDYDFAADSSYDDPGSGWDVAGVTNATANHTLIRKPGTTMGNIDWTASAGTDTSDSEWLVFDQNYFANIGGHPDDPCWDYVINLSVSSVIYGSEISYMLLDASGDTLASCFSCMANNQTNSYDLCLTGGAYSFWGNDSWGDSWNGGSFSVTADDGTVIAAGAVESTDGTNWVEFPFAIDEAVFSAADVDFAGVAIGGSDTKTLTVTNAGYGDSAIMVIDAVSSDNTAFAVSGTVPATLAGGESAAFSVTYTASAEGDEEAEVSVMYDGDTSSVSAFGYGVDAVFFEDFDPYTGSATELPMDGWTILDNNGDADSIPQLYKTWYHDDYGVGYSGNMVAYVGFSNNYDGDETIVTPMIHLDVPSKVTFQAYDYAVNLDVGYTESSTIDSSAELTHIATKYVDGFYTTMYEVILPDVDSLRVAFTFSGTAFTNFNLDEVSVVALPNTYVSGTVTDAETGSGVDSVAIDINGNTVYTDAAGDYALYGYTAGNFDLMYSKDGYNNASFYVEVAEGDSIAQDVGLAPENLTDYLTGFETGDDQGSATVESGTGTFAVTDSLLAIWTYDDTDTVTYNDTSWVTAYIDTHFLVYPDVGPGYEHEAFAYWQAGETFDVADYVDNSFLYLELYANYATEELFDFFYVGLMLDDSLIYWTYDGELTGSTNGAWYWYMIDVAWLAAMASETATPVIVFESDESWIDGWGGAFDNVAVVGNPFYLGPAQDLAAGSYGEDIPLSWGVPALTGAVNYEVRRMDPRNIDNIGWETMPNPDGEGEQRVRGPRNYETVSVSMNYNNSVSSRDLLSYDVFKREWPFGDWDLMVNVETNSYTDDDVDDGGYYDYYVTAVYDEGTSVFSNEASARAGMPEVVMMGETDFEDMTLGGWESISADPAAAFVVGDSAAAAASGAFTNTAGAVNPAPHGNFAYTGAGLMAPGDQVWLLSPNFDLLDNTSAEIRFSAYNPAYWDTGKLWARVNMGPWDEVMDVFQYGATGDWVEFSAPMSNYAGHDHVQLAFSSTYGTWFYGNGLALDDISLNVISGPQNLEAVATIDDITLSWDAPSDASRPNEYPNGVDPIEKDLALALPGNDDVLPPHPNFSRVQGDSIGNPFVIDSIPYFDDAEYHQIYWDSASTVGFTDDYDEACPYTGSTAPDVVYEFTLTHDAVKLFVDLCESYYDSKVFMYANGDVTDLVACNDDYCSASHGQTYTSYIEAADVPAGTYHIVIDGYGGASGTYVLNLGVQYNYPGLTYNVYKNGSIAEDELDTTAWVDGNASLLESDYNVTGTVYGSYISGGYPEMVATDTLIETESSNTVSLAMVNQPPGDFTMLTPSDGDTIVIEEDDLGSSLLFAWSSSIDPNGSQVAYNIRWWIDSPFWQEAVDDTSVTAYFVSYDDIAATLGDLGLVVATVNWQVYATDGYDETAASNGPRSVTFDAGWVLGIDDNLLPEVFALHQNYPNPFNPVTTIRFDVPQESHIRMDVYNILGQRVRTLMNGTMQPGYHAVRWDGTNDTGKPLASGMYIYRIHSNEFTSVKKLVLMK